jgi:hypothetical protein
MYGLGLVRGSDRALALAATSHHSPLDTKSGPTRVTSGKSRVRESRLPGSVRAKPNGRATRPRSYRVKTGALNARSPSDCLHILGEPALYDQHPTITFLRNARPVEMS